MFLHVAKGCTVVFMIHLIFFQVSPFFHLLINQFIHSSIQSIFSFIPFIHSLIPIIRGVNHSLEISGNIYGKSKISYALARNSFVKWEMSYAKCWNDSPLALIYAFTYHVVPAMLKYQVHLGKMFRFQSWSLSGMYITQTNGMVTLQSGGPNPTTGASVFKMVAGLSRQGGFDRLFWFVKLFNMYGCL